MAVLFIDLDTILVPTAEGEAIGTLPGGSSEGKLLTVLHSSDSGGTTNTPPSGWSSKAQRTANSVVRLSWTVIGASDPDLTWLCSPGLQQILQIMLQDDFDPDDPVSDYVERVDTVVTEPAPGPTQSTRDGGMVWVGYGGNNGFPTTVPDAPSGYTLPSGVNAQPSVESIAGGGFGACTAGVAYKAIPLADDETPGAWSTTIDAPINLTWVVNAAPAVPSTTRSPKFESDTRGRAVAALGVTTLVPDGIQIGDTLVYRHVCDSTETILMPGFNLVFNASFGANVTLAIGWRIADASDLLPGASHTTTSGTFESRVTHMARFSNAHPTAPIGALNTANFTAALPTCPTITTTAADAFVMRFYASVDARVAGPGFTGGAFGLRNESAVAGGDRNGVCSSGSDIKVQPSAGPSGAAAWGTRTQTGIFGTLEILPAPGEALDPIFLAGML